MYLSFLLGVKYEPIKLHRDIFGMTKIASLNYYPVLTDNDY